MTLNPLFALLSVPLNAALEDVKTRAGNIVADPTAKTAVAQTAGLAIDAGNVASFEGPTLAALAQEVINLAAAIQSHLTTAVTAPSPVVATQA